MNTIKRIAVIVIGIAIGCSNPKKDTDKLTKSAKQLEAESIATGVKSDSLNLGFYFGMTTGDYNKNIAKLLRENQIQITEDSSVISLLGTKNYELYCNSVYSFEDAKLFRCVNHIYPDKSKKISKNDVGIGSELISMVENGFGKEKYKNGTQGSKYFWLKGNKRIDYYDTLGRYIVALSDMKIEREIEAKKENEVQKAMQKENEEDEIILTKLKKKAQRDWPNDYTTQEFWLNEQKEAFEYMKGIPNDNVKKKAQRDWPLDFVTQKFWYNEQMEAKERLSK